MPQYDQVDWEKAACRGSIYTDLFYSVEETRSLQQYEYINALRQTCAGCPIFKECLEYAFQYEDYGVWGGMTTQEREAMRDPEKYPQQLRRAIIDFDEYGIDFKMLESCVVERTPIVYRR